MIYTILYFSIYPLLCSDLYVFYANGIIVFVWSVIYSKKKLYSLKHNKSFKSDNYILIDRVIFLGYLIEKL